MTPQERVLNVQARLVARGVKDIKFTWNRERLKECTRDQVYEDVAVALEAYLDGKCTRVEKFEKPIE